MRKIGHKPHEYDVTQLTVQVTSCDDKVVARLTKSLEAWIESEGIDNFNYQLTGMVDIETFYWGDIEC